MSSVTLSSCIIKSLQSGHMDSDLPTALLTSEKNKVRNRTEGVYWDYKESLVLNDKYQIAEFAKDIAAFHNTNGGVIIVGVNNDFAARGVPRSALLDTVQVRDKIRLYLGSNLDIFQDSFEIHDHKFIWLIFVRKYAGSPQCMVRHGPPEKLGRPTFVKGDYFYREADQVKRCISDGDIERVFGGFNSEHLNAYNYQVDDIYFRLLMPDYESFVGREAEIQEIKEALDSRHPLFALDGLGGVGKTAIAIEAVRRLYDEKKYGFIVSISAKSKVWLGHVKPKRATFAGLQGLLQELASVFPDIPKTEDVATLKRELIQYMKGVDGLILIDNLEEISDAQVLKFLGREVPAPVKVLVTTRVDKNIGPLTISIPAMTGDEAETLLKSELDRLAYQPQEGDENSFREILAAAGGVPLAIKWAAQIASERRSLRAASSILRGGGSGKQELLSFCFATMYDALSETAKNVGRLIPYLGNAWGVYMLNIVLDIPVETIKLAIHELSDKGIIFKVNDRDEGYDILPLAKDFLFGKFNESDELKHRVNRNFGDVFSSEQGGDVLAELAHWQEGRTANLLFSLAKEKFESNNYDHALKIVKLARRGFSDIRLRFLEGKVLYMTGNKPAGITHMRQAMSHSEGGLEAEDIFFYASALFMHGGKLAEREACETVLFGMEKAQLSSDVLLLAYLDCNLQRRDNSMIARILSKLDIDQLAKAVDRVDYLISDPSFYFAHDNVVLTALDRLRNYLDLDEEQRRRYVDAYEEVKSKLSMQNERARRTQA